MTNFIFWLFLSLVAFGVTVITGLKTQDAWNAWFQNKTPLMGNLEKHTVDPNKQFIIQFGQFNFLTDYQSISTGINLRKAFEFGYDYPMKIKIDNGRLLISASFNDKAGKLIAQIVDNQWVINPSNYFDLNFSINTLEVIDKDKVPVLQVDIKDGNNIFIGGVFYFPTKRLFMFGRDSMMTDDPKFDDKIALKKAKRLFKYPSRDYLGVRE